MDERVAFSTLIKEYSEIEINEQPEEIKHFYKRFSKYYELGQRHNYSEISSVIYNNADETLDLMAFNAEALYEIAVREDSKHARQFGKFLDHVNLAIYQKYFIMKLIHETRDDNERLKADIKSTRRTLQTNIRHSNNRIEEMNKNKNKLYSEFTVVLGIFAAIIFAAFGGLEILDNILGDIRQVPTPKLLVFSSLSIGAVITLLFILLSGLSKITGNNYSSCGCDSKSRNCRHTVFTKHPAIMVISFLLFYIAGIGAFGYIIDYEEILNLFITFDIKGNGTKLLFLLYLILFPIAFLIPFYCSRRSDRKKDDNRGASS